MTNYKTLIPKLIARNDPYALTDAFGVCRELEQENAVHVDGTGRRDYGTTVYNKDNFAHAHEFSKEIRSAAMELLRANNAPDMMLDLYYKTHLFDAPHNFDSFCIYIEKDRAPEKQFYVPRLYRGWRTASITRLAFPSHQALARQPSRSLGWRGLLDATRSCRT